MKQRLDERQIASKLLGGIASLTEKRINEGWPEKPAFVELSDKLMKSSGPSDTVEGEIVRAINKITYRFYNDGDFVHTDYGIETAGSAFIYLINMASKYRIPNMVSTLAQLAKAHGEKEYGTLLSQLIDNAVAFITPRMGELTPNTLDMLDYDKEATERFGDASSGDEDPYDDDVEESKAKESKMTESTDKPVIDLLGKTKAVLQYAADHWEAMKKAGNDRYIKDEKEFWPWLISGIKDELKVTSEALLFSGMPASIVVEAMTEADETPAKPEAKPEAPAKPEEKKPEAKPDAKPSPYTEVHLKKKDGNVTKVAWADVLKKIAPYTKNFKTPEEGLLKGKPDQILKVLQSVFGQDVVQWTAPAGKAKTEAANLPSPLISLAITELFNQDKSGVKSVMFDIKDNVRSVNEEFVRSLCDAFDKDDKTWLISMFPHSAPEHLNLIVQETKSVLDEIGGSQIDILFPNIDKSYLVNVKEGVSSVVTTESAIVESTYTRMASTEEYFSGIGRTKELAKEMYELAKSHENEEDDESGWNESAIKRAMNILFEG